jgi:hypothetical protein
MTTAKTKFLVTSSHDEDLEGGRVVSPGEVITDVDVKEPHNQQLVDDGRLTEMPKAKKSQGTTTKEDDGS